MADQKRASELAGRGLDLWTEGRLPEAAVYLREAIHLADPDHYCLSEYHGSLGGVLSAMGMDEHALLEYREALRIVIAEYSSDASAAVAVARYFVADQLLKMRRESEALSCLAPSLPVATTTESVLRCVESLCLWQLDRREEAIRCARRAIEAARSDEQRENIRNRLSAILPRDDANLP